MPKAPSKPAPTRAAKETNPHVLKRHQACHQCRKRKMKCDAKRPCSSCVRSHAYAIMHAAPGTELPSAPECTFDEVAELVYSADDEHEERYVVLETRILELENLLRSSRGPEGTITRTVPSQGRGSSHGLLSTSTSCEQDTRQPQRTPTLLSNREIARTSDSDESGDSDYFVQPDGHWSTSGASSFGDAPSPMPLEGYLNSAREGTEILHPSWPRRLPPPAVVRHLAEAFLSFHVHAHHMLHAPSFIASLLYPPNHPQFPITPLLHAICAIGSCYTSPDPSNWMVYRHTGKRKDKMSFSDEQAQYAKRLTDDNVGFGHHLMQHLQANILLSWYYWLQARWVEVYTRVASTLRVAVSLGLNLAPQFACISTSMRPASLIPPATTALEEEMRRNTFWIAYALERQYGSSNGWALSLDDQDVFQLLPLRSDLYDPGSHDVLLIHPANQTDSFILYIKSSMLLSRVKNFNLRTRAKYFAEDPSLPQAFSVSDVRFDPRETPEFGTMNSIALAFTDSLPSRYKDPIAEGVIDPYIYSTLMAPLISLILLHEPYAMVGKDSCLSAYHILTSARSIASLIHMIVSTSYDCAKLGLFPVFAWFTSARVLTRFLRSAQEENYGEQIRILEDEISFILAVLRKLGERVPISNRYSRMLEDHILKTCGTGTAAKLCSSGPSDRTDLGFAPEMQEGDTADKLLSLRLASLDAFRTAGNATASLANWPVSAPGGPVVSAR